VRKITRPDQRHNRAGRAALGILAGGLLLAGLGTGCSGDRPPAQGAAATGDVHRGAACPLVATRTGLAEFLDLADRVAAGEPVTVDAMVEVASSPVWDRWRRSFEPEAIPAAAAGRTLFIALVGQDALPPRLRDKTYRADLVVSYETTLARRAEITAFVDDFLRSDAACDVRTQLSGWLPAAELPDTLRIDLVVGHPEIRLFEDHFLVDASLAWAAGRQQLVNFLASTLYKHVAVVAGPAPANARGGDILLHSLRLVFNEAAPAYLDHMAEVAFDPRHPQLAKIAMNPDDLAGQAVLTLGSLDAGLTAIRRRPAPTDEDWLGLYRLFVGAQAWQPTGWFMAQVIADRLGEARLQAAARSVPDFYAAYQRACAAPAGSAAPGVRTVAAQLANPPALSADNAAWLDRELRRLFP